MFLDCRRMRFDPFLSPCTKLNSRWIKDLHIKPDTLKLSEKKLGKTFEDMGTGEKFLNRTPIAYALRSRIDKWDLIKLQSFCKSKDTVKRTKRQPTNWEKIFTNPTSDRGLISNIYKELKKVDSREPNNPIKKCGTELNKEFSPEEFRMAEKHLKDIGTGEKFLNRTPIAYALRSRIDKWDLTKLQSFCKQRTPSKGQIGNQQIWKRSSPILHQIEG